MGQNQVSAPLPRLAEFERAAPPPPERHQRVILRGLRTRNCLSLSRLKVHSGAYPASIAEVLISCPLWWAVENAAQISANAQLCSE